LRVESFTFHNTLLKLSIIFLFSNSLFLREAYIGGTALSLHLGHRMSIDIDLFTDQEYRTVNFEVLENHLSNKYAYFNKSNGGLIGISAWK
ncbi:hypothetical protein J2T02_005655, partial [Chitinophaga terrae (ex Kim and Jung 2007)]|uniref:nucleotidyl transferase AbiEii/AbiGii toxin family protein n=1 Tax=Chitinophaga terrae (ex Kim and Jung 2007) TaxID=408074 RepID=UPI002785C1FA